MLRAVLQVLSEHPGLLTEGVWKISVRPESGVSVLRERGLQGHQVYCEQVHQPVEEVQPHQPSGERGSLNFVLGHRFHDWKHE